MTKLTKSNSGLWYSKYYFIYNNFVASIDSKKSDTMLFDMKKPYKQLYEMRWRWRTIMVYSYD